MNSQLYMGEVMHARLEPARHAFRYPVFFFALDLDELDQVDQISRLLGHNRRALLSLHDADHLDQRPGSLRAKLLRLLFEHGLRDDIARITMVTSLRYLGHVFNPVTFYYCHRPDGSLRCMVAEVNNTFGERHLYVLTEPSAPRPGMLARYEADKQFHVSPFNNMEGNYTFDFSAAGDGIDIRIDLHRQGHEVLKTRISGHARPLTAATLRRTLLRHPVQALLTLPRIHAQAARLFFAKRLKFFHKPAPRSDQTIRVNPPTLWQALCMKLVLPYLSKITRGHLSLVLPSREARHYGTPGQEPSVQVRVLDYRFFSRILRFGDIGFGESYMAGEWETDDLPALIRLFIANRQVFEDRHLRWAWLGRAINRAGHLLRSNHLFNSRRNIREHYDLSNEFFRLFLDPTMMYSCALYSSPDESLEEAQRNKLHALIRKARIQPADHVLEIGTGWGSFAIEAVRQTGCRVTTITISEEQHALARKRVQEAGLEDRIHVEFCDYRRVAGQYDKIVSIEMIEAVGHEYLGKFFEVCDRVLKPHGLVAVQVITIPDQRYDAYRMSVDWIQKHIFPGGHLPSLQALSNAMTRHSHFVVEQLDNIGINYAQTLREWRQRFEQTTDKVKAMGFDETFVRKWLYYFSYCEAAFATRTLNTLHLVLTRPNNPTLDHGAAS